MSDFPSPPAASPAPDAAAVPAGIAQRSDAAHVFFAACPRNVSDLLAAELRSFGIEVDREHPAGVSFHGSLRSGYVACLRSRTASRVLLTLGEFDASDPDRMHAGLRTVPWESHVRADGSFAVDVVGESPPWLRHTQFAA
ncbi:MAG: hypothetical protein ACR2I8_02800, partial [Steroidobacteraceae bacterium]